SAGLRGARAPLRSSPSSDWGRVKDATQVCATLSPPGRGKGENMGGDYMTGFGTHFATEAVSGALPVGRNSPQKPAFGLYAEQLSGTAFTAPRGENRRSWLYRLRSAAVHKAFTPLPSDRLRATLCSM